MLMRRGLKLIPFFLHFRYLGELLVEQNFSGRSIMNHPFDLKIAELESLNIEFTNISDDEANEIAGGVSRLHILIPGKPGNDFTTLAVGEEGGGSFTTKALGEEGGDTATTLALGEEGGGIVTTLAVGEEGGDMATTLALGEEGGH
jgi:hypothetical protein